MRAAFAGTGVAELRSGTDYERSDVPPLLVVTLAGGLALTVAALLVALRLAYPAVAAPGPRGPVAALPPKPELVVAPGRELAAYRAGQTQKLAGIDDAMNRVAAQGWDTSR